MYHLFKWVSFTRRNAVIERFTKCNLRRYHAKNFLAIWRAIQPPYMYMYNHCNLWHKMYFNNLIYDWHKMHFNNLDFNLVQCLGGKNIKWGSNKLILTGQPSFLVIKTLMWKTPLNWKHFILIFALIFKGWGHLSSSILHNIILHFFWYSWHHLSHL